MSLIVRLFHQLIVECLCIPGDGDVWWAIDRHDKTIYHLKFIHDDDDGDRTLIVRTENHALARQHRENRKIDRRWSDGGDAVKTRHNSVIIGSIGIWEHIYSQIISIADWSWCARKHLCVPIDRIY